MEKDRKEEMVELLIGVVRDFGYDPEGLVYQTKIGITFGFNTQKDAWDGICEAVLELADFLDFPQNDPGYKYEYETNSDNYTDLLDYYKSRVDDAIAYYEKKVK